MVMVVLSERQSGGKSTLTEPSGVFIARDFDIRDGDTVYVTEAPFVRWQKTLSALTGGLTTANTIDSIANGD